MDMVPLLPKKTIALTGDSSNSVSKDPNPTQASNKITDTYPSRQYTLDRNKALKTKLQNCQNTHIKWVMKSGKNLVINLSTAAFEFFRYTLPQMLKEKSDELSLAFVTKDNTDESGAIVDSTYRVTNLKKDGTPGQIHKFTVNLYRTQSSVLANGSKVETFIDHFLLPLEAQILTLASQLDSKHQSIRSALMPIPSSHDETNGDKQIDSTSNSTVAACSQIQKITDLTQMNQTQSTSQFLCPHCQQQVEEGIL